MSSVMFAELYADFAESEARDESPIYARLLARSPQTNEAGRCAVLLPVLAALVRELPGHWLANDTTVLVRGELMPQPPDDDAYNLLALDGSRWHGPVCMGRR